MQLKVSRVICNQQATGKIFLESISTYLIVSAPFVQATAVLDIYVLFYARNCRLEISFVRRQQS